MASELGETTDPTALVPGDAGVVEENARVVRVRARHSRESGEALRRIDAGGWSGEAADLWHEQHQTDVPLWLHGADSLETAAAALEEYGEMLRWAQGQATEAIRGWREAQAVSRQAKAEHDQAVAQAPGGVPAPFVDPGEQQRQAARDVLRRARQQLIEAGDRTAATLREEAAVAPRDSQSQTYSNFMGAIWEGFSGIFESIGQVFTDTAGTVSAIIHNVTHPVETFKEAVSWDDFANGRGEVGLGKITGEFLGTVATGGVGKVLKTLVKRPDSPENRVGEQDKRKTGDPIDVATGDMVLAQTDVEFAGALPLVLKRVHVSSYRAGRSFGPTWVSTVDQRLEVEEAGVYFAAEDGTLLVYPLPGPGSSVLPVTGPRRPLARSEDGDYTITDTVQGRTLCFGSGGDVLPLLSITDRNGHRIDIDRDSDGIPREIRHSGGYRVRVESDDGRVTALYSRTAEDEVPLMRYGYEHGHLTEVVNSSGAPLVFSYDAAGRITSWTDRNGAWYRYTYDEHGRVVRADGSGGFFSGTLEYDRDRLITYWTNSLGQRTAYHLNERGQTLREVDPLGNETRFEWDSGDRLLARTDPLGHRLRYDYDEHGNLITVTRADGRQTVLEYNELRLPVTIIAADGTVARREYDGRGNLVRGIDGAGAVTSLSYDEHGHLAQVTDPLGNVQRVSADSTGLPVEVTDALGGVTRYERDFGGRVTAITDPLGGVTRIGWTVDGKPAWRTHPDGATEHWQHDGEGNPRGYVDPLGQTTRTEVTHFDLPSAEVRPDGTRLEFGYDTELRLTSVTNEQGLVWRYDYDPAGRLIQETDFNGRRVSYRYDAAGRLAERVNGAGETTSFTHDVLGNVIERRSEAVVSTYTYDEVGRLVEAMDDDTQVAFERDPLGRVLAETINGRTVTSTYDAAGRRISRRTRPALRVSGNTTRTISPLPCTPPDAPCTSAMTRRVARYSAHSA